MTNSNVSYTALTEEEAAAWDAVNTLSEMADWCVLSPDQVAIIEAAAANCEQTAAQLRGLLGQEPEPELTLYSQRDPRWRDEVYAGGMTFGQAGCYVTSVAMILSLAGYTDTPPEVAAKLREAGCFSGALLGRPDRIPDAYPLMRYDGPVDVSRDGPLRWHHGFADMERVALELEAGPVIMEADFIVATKKFNQHFVVAEAMTEDGDDIFIADPWDGSATRLLERYAQGTWSLERTVYGLRLLRVAG
jgi:hypothetical protein